MAAVAAPANQAGPASAPGTTPTRPKVSGPRKAAMLLVSLDPEIAAQVMKHCRPEDMEAITREIISLEAMDPKAQSRVIQECYDLSTQGGGVASSGQDYAEELLSRTLGKESAEQFMSRLTSRRDPPFQFVVETDPVQLATYLQDEHPQTIALILSHLLSDRAAAILANLPQELQAVVALRIAQMDRANPEVVKEVEEGLRRKLSTVINQDYSSVGGKDFLVALLNEATRSTERAILEGLASLDPTLAEEIKAQLFVFEDIAGLDDKTIQRILREVDAKLLPMALKGASDRVKEKVFANMSQRAAELLKEDMEAMGPIRVSQVESAQQSIVHTIRDLDEKGEVIISRGEKADEYV